MFYQKIINYYKEKLNYNFIKILTQILIPKIYRLFNLKYNKYKKLTIKQIEKVNKWKLVWMFLIISIYKILKDWKHLQIIK